MIKHTQLTHLLLLVFVVILVTACGPQGNTTTSAESIDIGIIVQDHMQAAMETFQATMAERGYVEGQNITYHIYEFDSQVDDPAVPTAEEAQTFDIMLTLEAGDDDTEALGRAAALTNGETPILFTADNNFPFEAGYVDSVTNPGKNVTGVLQESADDKRLELFLDMIPDAQRIYVVYDTSDPDTQEIIDTLNTMAASLDIELVPVLATEVESLAADPPTDIDGIFPVKVHYEAAQAWFDFAREQQLPLSYEGYTGGFESPFALMNYTEDRSSVGVKLAGLADQILNGVNPGDLPVEKASFFLTIDLTIAEELNLEIPDGILEQADEIIRAND